MEALKVIQQIYKNNWRHENALGGSELAILFPNELTQDEVSFKSKVSFPIMTSPKLQTGWSQENGFVENDATEKEAEVELTEAFTSYTKIAKINSAAEAWAENKITVLEAIEAETYDEFVLNKICNGLVNKYSSPVKITKDNLVIEFKKLEKEAKKLKFKLKNCIILISPSVVATIVNSNISTSVSTIENTNITIRKLFNKYTTVEADIDDVGYQIVALLPSAFAWASGVETPLQAGQYVQGPYLGQIFTAVNKFYGAKVIMPQHIIGYEEPKSPTKTSTSGEYVSPTLDQFKQKSIEDLREKWIQNSKFESEFKKTSNLIANAKTTEEVIEIAKNFEKIMQKE